MISEAKVQTLPPNTSHLLMWFCDGKNIPEDALPLPIGNPNYLQTIIEECEKLKPSNTPVYLAYMGRLLTDKQKQAIEKLPEYYNLDNLLVVDYDEIEKSPELSLTEDQKQLIDTYAKEYQAKQLKTIEVGGIGILVDLCRLILLKKPSLLKKHLKAKYQHKEEKGQILANCGSGLVYRDFDVMLTTYDGNLEVINGFLCSTNHKAIIKKDEFDKLIESVENADLKKEVQDFYSLYFLNIDNFIKLLPYNKRYNQGFNQEHEAAKTELIEKLESYPALKKFIENTATFFANFNLENSLLIVNKDEHPIITQAIEWCTDPNKHNSPYGALQHSILSDMSRPSPAIRQAMLKMSHKQFIIGNDLTWQGAKKLEYRPISTIVESSSSSPAPRLEPAMPIIAEEVQSTEKEQTYEAKMGAAIRNFDKNISEAQKSYLIDKAKIADKTPSCLRLYRKFTHNRFEINKVESLLKALENKNHDELCKAAAINTGFGFFTTGKKVFKPNNK